MNIYDFLIQKDYKEILSTINREEFSVFVEKYKDVSPFPGYSKYLDIENWFKVKLKEIYRLKLHKSKPMNILDLGTGAGYFPYICSYYGHNVRALDLDTIQMYNDLIKFLKINRIGKSINAFEDLPDFGIKFDLITAYSICFNNHDTPELWGVEEWNYFLNDIACNQLNENGSILLVLNGERNGKFYEDELYNFFLLCGAKINGARVHFSNVTRSKFSLLNSGVVVGE